MIVAVLGASPNRERYSNKAVRKLREHGHTVIPVNPGHEAVEGLTTVPDLGAIDGPVHTVTVYVGPAHIEPLIDGIVALRPERVIVNPGAESPVLAQRLAAAKIPLVEACTLVMLSIGQF